MMKNKETLKIFEGLLIPVYGQIGSALCDQILLNYLYEIHEIVF